MDDRLLRSKRKRIAESSEEDSDHPPLKVARKYTDVLRSSKTSSNCCLDQRRQRSKVLSQDQDEPEVARKSTDRIADGLQTGEEHDHTVSGANLAGYADDIRLFNLYKSLPKDQSQFIRQIALLHEDIEWYNAEPESMEWPKGQGPFDGNNFADNKADQSDGQTSKDVGDGNNSLGPGRQQNDQPVEYLKQSLINDPIPKRTIRSLIELPDAHVEGYWREISESRRFDARKVSKHADKWQWQWRELQALHDESESDKAEQILESELDPVVKRQRKNVRYLQWSQSWPRYMSANESAFRRMRLFRNEFFTINGNFFVRGCLGLRFDSNWNLVGYNDKILCKSDKLLEYLMQHIDSPKFGRLITHRYVAEFVNNRHDFAEAGVEHYVEDIKLLSKRLEVASTWVEFFRNTVDSAKYQYAMAEGYGDKQQQDRTILAVAELEGMVAQQQSKLKEVRKLHRQWTKIMEDMRAGVGLWAPAETPAKGNVDTKKYDVVKKK